MKILSLLFIIFSVSVSAQDAEALQKKLKELRQENAALKNAALQSDAPKGGNC